MVFDKEVSQNRDHFNFRLELLRLQLERCKEQLTALEEKERNPTQEELTNDTIKEFAAKERDFERKLLLTREKTLNDKIAAIIKDDVNGDAQKWPHCFKCNACNREFERHETRQHCTECFNYDLCEQCYAAQGHEHLMVPEPILSHEVVWKGITQDTKTVCELFVKMFKTFPHRPCLGYKIDKESGKIVTVYDYIEGSQEELFANIHKYDYKWLTFQQVETRVRNIGSALAAKFPAQTHIGISSRNCVEWFMTDLACQMYSYVTVPLHFALKEDDATFIVNNANVKAVVCSSDLVPIYLEAVSHCPQLEFIVQMENVDYSQQEQKVVSETNRENKKLMYTLEEWELMGKDALSEPRKREAQQLATLIYTSGSTGRPKGAMITDKIWRTLLSEGRYPEDPLVGVSKDSLAHISDREVTYTVLINGGRIGISNDPRTVYVDILLVQPVFVDSTPRFYDVIYNEFKKALAIEEHSLMVSLGLSSLTTEQKGEIRRAVLNKFSGILGGRITNIGMGGAAVNPIVKAFCIECFKSASVREGYGTTEVGNIADDRGDVRYGVVFKLIDVPEMGYFTSDNPPKGELLVKSSSSVKGYFNNTDDTQRNFDEEGYFRTGDIVEQLGPRNVRIIDRKKNIFKLSQGEFVSPEPLETMYMDSPYVEQILITCGDSNLGILQTSVTAVVVPNQVLLMKWAAEKGLVGDFTALCASKEGKEFILKNLIEMGQKKRLRSFEIPCAVVLDPVEWTVQNGKMTSSSKKCRPVLEKLYRPLVNEVLLQLGEQSTQQQLQLIMNEVLGKDGAEVLKDKSNFTSLGGDSLSAIKLVALVKQNFNVDLSLEALYSNSSMSDIAATITSNMNNVNFNNHNTALEQAIKMRQDIALDSDIQPPSESSEKLSVNSVFVTGATGFIGSFVVNYLVQDTAYENAKIYCLVRANDSERALTRLKNTFVSHGLDAEKIMQRVRPLAGDLEKRNFGLEHEVYEALAAEVDAIFHIGATVNHILPYSKMKAANVDSVVDVLRFACTKKLKLVNYASTLGVFYGKTTVIKEDTDIETNNLQDLGGYNQTKWVAEKILQEARQRGVTVNIFRPGLITWSAENGAFNPQDWLHHLVVGSILMGKAPQARSKFNFGSVDSAAKAIAILGKQPLNKNFHLTSTSLISSEEFFEFVSQVRISPEGNLNKTVDLWNEKLKNLTKRVLFPQWIKLVQSEINNTPIDSPRRTHLTCLLYFAKGIPSDESWSVDQTNVATHAPEITYPQIDKHSVEKFVKRLLEAESIFHEK